MGIRADLLKFYFEAETKYYALCDWLEKQSLPVYEYFVTPIEKSGYPSFPIALGVLAILLVGVLFAFTVPSAFGSKSVHISVLGNNSAPIEGALVELLSGQSAVVASASTNSTGEVFFEDKKNALQIRITYEGYVDSLKAVRENVNVQLMLKSTSALRPPVNQPVSNGINFSGNIDQFIEMEQFGSFQVNLKQVGTNASVNGMARVFDSATDNLISETRSVGGIAIFENLQVNQHVYFHAIVPGFLGNKSGEFTVRRERQNVELKFLPVQMVNATIRVVSNATQQSLQGADVRVYDENNVQIANGTTTASGNLTFLLPAGIQYYATAKKPAFITSISGLFSPTQNISLGLSPAVPDSLSMLTVRFRDDYNASIQGIASISLTDGRIIDQVNSPSESIIFQNLQRGINVLVRGSSHDLTRQQTVLLNASLVEMFLYMEFRFAFLSFNAKNALTQEQVNANVEVIRNGEVYGNCTTACTLRVKTRGQHNVRFSHAEFFNYIFNYGANPSHQAFEEGAVIQVNASMMPLTGVQDSQVLLNGVFDAATYEQIPIGGTLKQNRVYIASLSGYFANARVASVFFSPSITNPAKISILDFTPYPEVTSGAPNGLEVRTSTESNLQECASGLTGNKWKRLLLEVPRDSPEAFSQNYEFYFVAQPPSQTDFYNTLTAVYKSFIRKVDGSVVRNPFDQNKVSNEISYTGTASECTGANYSANFNVMSPNQEMNELGTLSMSFQQNREISLIETTPSPESCGTVIGSGDTVSDYDSFDCNGFPVDADSNKLLEVNAKIQLSHNAKRGIVRFSANPEFFTVLNASTKATLEKFLATQPDATVFEMDVTPSLSPTLGSRDIYFNVNLSATGLSERSQITVEFIEIFENGTTNTVSLQKTIWVSLNPITLVESQSLLSQFSCGNQTSIKFSYNSGLLPTGSGWVGCNEIPLIVDPIFPADAVPIYVENTTGNTDCTLAEGDSRTWGVRVDNPAQVENGPTNGQCFELVEDTDLSLDLLPAVFGYKGYVLKFNAAKCGGVTGNDVFVTNATLRLTCAGRVTQTSALDTKQVNVTVFKQGGELLKNLAFFHLVTNIDFKNGTTIPIDPKIYALIDNLQKLKSADSDKRDLSFKVLPSPGAVEYVTIPLADQPAKAFGVAIRSAIAPSVYSVDSNSVFLQENDNVLPMEVQPRLGVVSREKPFLEYVKEANDIRLSSAFRRTVSSQGSLHYWCIDGETFSLDTSVCRPTINDWIKNVQSSVTQTQVCTACSPGNNCDSTCSVTTHTKQDGSACLNFCAPPVCDSRDVCNPATRTKQVSIPGRITQEWVNTSNLVAVPLFNVDGLELAADDPVLQDAPFKYFADYAEDFNYSVIAFMDKTCKDSPGHFDRSGSCFADAGTRDVLRRYGQVYEGVNLIWFGTGSGAGDAKYGTLRLTEEKGGCSQSSVWDRGYYRITFSYVKDSQGWNWQYSAAPLEVSSNYVQLDPARDVKNCAATSLGGGTFEQQPSRRTNLCYFIFSTSAQVTSDGNTPGYCVRSLRDYIPSYPTDALDNRNYIAKQDLEQLKSSFIESLMDDRPGHRTIFDTISAYDSQNNYYSVLVRQLVLDKIYIRDLALGPSYGRAKCSFLNDDPIFGPSHADPYNYSFHQDPATTWISCMGGPVCLNTAGSAIRVPPPQLVDFKVGTFGLTPAGTIDWLANVSYDTGVSRDTCGSTFAGGTTASWDNWDDRDGDTAFAFKYDAVGFDGQKKPGGPFLCHTGCYIDCDSDYALLGSCPGRYD